MNPDARTELLEACLELGLSLSPTQVGQLGTFIQELQKWNKKINLTAIRDEREIVLKHLVDSLTLVKVVEKSHSLVDIGSGGGFPGLPLKIACPELQIVSVDAVEKKILFQRNIIRLLGLSGIQAVHARAERIKEQYPDGFDVAVSRAFSDIPSFVRIALPLIKNNGAIIAMKGRSGAGEAEAAGEFFDQVGLSVEIREFNLPLTEDRRSLVILRREEQAVQAATR